jgi:hypothetical protein
MITLVELLGEEQPMQQSEIVLLKQCICKHRTANIYFLETDIVSKPITFRIDEYFIVRKP